MAARRVTSGLLMVLACVILAGGGCGGDTKKTVDKAKRRVKKAAKDVEDVAAKVEKVVKEKLKIENGLEINNMGEPIKVATCHIFLHTFNDQRPGALQLKSYKAINQESYPSIFIQAPVRGINNPSQLAGQTLPAMMYVMTEQEGAVWRATDVELKITSVDGAKIGGEIVSGTLLNTTDNTQITISGKFGGQL